MSKTNGLCCRIVESETEGDSDEEECVICMDRKARIILPCSHSYCEECIEAWLDIFDCTTTEIGISFRSLFPGRISTVVVPCAGHPWAVARIPGSSPSAQMIMKWHMKRQATSWVWSTGILLIMIPTEGLISWMLVPLSFKSWLCLSSNLMFLLIIMLVIIITINKVVVV